MATKPQSESQTSLWVAESVAEELPLVSDAIETAAPLAAEDFQPLDTGRIAPFLTPLSVELLATPTQDK